MRTGHQSLNCLEWQGNNIIILCFRTRATLFDSGTQRPHVGGFRSHFSYNNWAYGNHDTGHRESWPASLCTNFCGSTYSTSLGLKRTKMQDSVPMGGNNSAASYAIQDDRTPVRVASPSIGAGLFTESGSGVLSTIDDMLPLYSRTP